MSFIAERHILADLDHVFEIISNFERYPHWNPCYPRILPTKKGEDLTITEGKVFQVICRWKDGKLEKYANKVVSMNKPHTLEMREVTYPKWMVDSRSVRQIVPHESGKGVVYRVHVTIEGKMKDKALKMYGEKIEDQINREADALKEHAEKKV